MNLRVFQQYIVVAKPVCTLLTANLTTRHAFIHSLRVVHGTQELPVEEDTKIPDLLSLQAEIKRIAQGSAARDPHALLKYEPRRDVLRDIGIQSKRLPWVGGDNSQEAIAQSKPCTS